jgi:hypothetical protein
MTRFLDFARKDGGRGLGLTKAATRRSFVDRYRAGVYDRASDGMAAASIALLEPWTPL